MLGGFGIFSIIPGPYQHTWFVRSESEKHCACLHLCLVVTTIIVQYWEVCCHKNSFYFDYWFFYLHLFWESQNCVAHWIHRILHRVCGEHGGRVWCESCRGKYKKSLFFNEIVSLLTRRKSCLFRLIEKKLCQINVAKPDLLSNFPQLFLVKPIHTTRATNSLQCTALHAKYTKMHWILSVFKMPFWPNLNY